MKRLFALLLALGVLVAAGGSATPTADSAATPDAAAKRCTKGFRHAVIARRHECLRVGASCRARLDRLYHRHRLHCVAGRLRRSHPSPPRPRADLSITMSDAPDPVAAGADLTYTLVLRNDGPNAARDVTVTDTLPSGLTLVGLGTSPLAAATCTGRTTVSCTKGSLVAGGSVVIELTVRPLRAGTLSNTASVSSATADPNRGNNSATQTTAVNPPPQLRRRRG